MTINGYAAHFNKANLNGEIVLKRSFDRFFEAYNHLAEIGFRVPINFNHDATRIVGIATSIAADEVGLYVTAEIADEALIANHIDIMISDGSIEAFSTEGYIDYDTIKDNQDGTYVANNFYLTAIAIVPNPADPQAVFSSNARKSVFGKEIAGNPIKNINPLIYI